MYENIRKLSKKTIKDWCTKWPEGIYSPETGKWETWGYCCREHDRDYTKKIGRLAADNKLFKCVKDSGHPYMAAIMWLGVRVFGWLHY